MVLALAGIFDRRCALRLDNCRPCDLALAGRIAIIGAFGLEETAERRTWNRYPRFLNIFVFSDSAIRITSVTLKQISYSYRSATSGSTRIARRAGM